MTINVEIVESPVEVTVADDGIIEVNLNLSTVTVETSTTGPQGAQGAAGPANTLSIGTVTVGQQPNATITGTAPNQTLNLVFPPNASVFYTHVQSTPSAVWTINHNLNGYPTAVVLDSAGSQCEGAISYSNANTMVITFSGGFSGTAYVI